MGEYDEKGSTVMAKELLDVKQLFVNVEDKEILRLKDWKRRDPCINGTKWCR